VSTGNPRITAGQCKDWRTLKGNMIARHIGVLKFFDDLPRSADVAFEVCCAHSGVSYATGERWIRQGKWPPFVKGYGTRKINVGAYRDARVALAAAPKRKRRRQGEPVAQAA
jgi:hypothetical protein